ncbi:MAG: tRNA (adenosine(37)-N6)-threonylcarbamoyltransferase complex transferase subunit TsaD [Elusimicrobia bacterium]|nr:tRNA (adenosine(37)-N6)-threonylcarbamoyltransferase complex transferase subunit TsaD [Elusimicrobiota bacterium]
MGLGLRPGQEAQVLGQEGGPRQGRDPRALRRAPQGPGCAELALGRQDHRDALRVLGIETSCDETAAAVVDGRRGLLSNVVSSQLHLHRKYRGIVPELASRAHLQKIAGVIETACDEAGGGALDAVAYTQGPGLMGPLLVGKVAAQTLARILGVPLVGVNHLEGHIFATELTQELHFPLVALIVSGGHTDLVLSRGPGRYRVLGRTRDDAAGEAFDKVARMLGLGYPGGPVIDRRAASGDPRAVEFPRPYMPDTWDFSFAGLKTAVLYHLQRRGGKKLSESEIDDICASFQDAIVDTLVQKTLAAAANFSVKDVALGGGVAANSRLREVLAARGVERGLRVVMPPRSLCTDNGAMIAQVAVHRLKRGRLSNILRSDPSLSFQNWGA